MQLGLCEVVMCRLPWGGKAEGWHICKRLGELLFGGPLCMWLGGEQFILGVGQYLFLKGDRWL